MKLFDSAEPAIHALESCRVINQRPQPPSAKWEICAEINDDDGASSFAHDNFDWLLRDFLLQEKVKELFIDYCFEQHALELEAAAIETAQAR